MTAQQLREKIEEIMIGKSRKGYRLMVLKAGGTMDSVDLAIEYAVNHILALFREAVTEIIGDPEEVRDRSDMMDAVYHRVKGRNELRKEQRTRLSHILEER